jgi:hypothetical protein
VEGGVAVRVGGVDVGDQLPRKQPTHGFRVTTQAQQVQHPLWSTFAHNTTHGTAHDARHSALRVRSSRSPAEEEWQRAAHLAHGVGCIGIDAGRDQHLEDGRIRDRAVLALFSSLLLTLRVGSAPAASKSVTIASSRPSTLTINAVLFFLFIYLFIYLFIHS